MENKFVMSMDECLPLRDVVFNTLRQAILTGELQPGERLMEIHLADRLGVSRTPIREAIRKLELEGLVDMLPRRGAEVARITEKSMNDVLEVRTALDELCVELACLRISDDEKKTLKEACLSFEKAVSLGDLKMIAQADVNFHDIIVKATGNERLQQILNNLSLQTYRYRYEYIRDLIGHKKLVEEHQRIFDSIVNGDVATAKEVTRIHIENQRKAIIEQIRLEKK